MRRTAKAPSAGSIQATRRLLRRISSTAAFVCLVLLVLLPGFALAQKGTVAIVENAGDAGVAVNEATGNVYVADGDQVNVFDSDGNPLFQFGSPGSDAGQLNEVRGIAINQTSGDVYLVDHFNVRISQFDASGNFIRTWGNDVDEDNPSLAFEVCTAVSGHTCKAGNIGSGKGQLYPETGSIQTWGSYVAVAPDGRVYVTEPGGSAVGSGELAGNRRIEIFSAAGDWLGEFGVSDCPENFPACDPTTSEPRGVAVDSSGIVYTTPHAVGVFSTAPNRVYAVRKFTSAGNPIGEFAPTSVTNRRPLQIAADPNDGHLYVYQLSENNSTYEVAEYSNAGKLVEHWGIGIPGQGFEEAASSGLAINSNLNKVYLTPGEGRLFILDTLTVLPEASISPATGVDASTATLHGSVNPQGTPLDTGWHFEYRNQGDSIWTVSPVSDVIVGNGTAAVLVDHEITGLEPNTTYETRLVAQRESGAGISTSSIATFTTDPVLPVLSLVAATRVTDTTATLQAMIDPKHSATTYRFNYGTDTSYGHSAPGSGTGGAGSQLGGSGVFEPITGLQPGTVYHVRLIAQSVGGTAESDDFTFTTRTAAEISWPARAMRLVNQPDIGNQSVLPAGEAPISPDGSRVLWVTGAGAPGATTGSGALYLSDATPGGWVSRSIAVPANQQPGGGDYAYNLVALSADLTGAVFMAESGLIDENHPHVLVRMDDQEDHEVIADFGSLNLEGLGNTLSVSSGAKHVIFPYPVSHELVDFHDGTLEVLPTPSCGYSLPADSRYVSEPDVSKIFFTSRGSGSCSAPDGIFVLDRSEASPTPALISGPQTGDATLIRINRAGTEALFLKEGDLHRWAFGEGTECLTCGKLPSGVSIILPAASNDLSHVYFCGKIPLRIGRGDPCDIYVWRQAGIAHVAEVQAPGPPMQRGSVQITPDGDTLVFTSLWKGTTGDPTGWDELDASNNVSNIEDSRHAYRYDDTLGTVECVSCSGSALAAKGIQEEPDVSADGNTVAFVSKGPLVPEDINGRQDVYEWHNGRLRLVTDGETEFISSGGALFGAPSVWGLSEDGRTLVFSAGDVKLTGHELNPFANAYSATVGGTPIPAELPPAHCKEDSCQGPLQSAPRPNSQGSSDFQGKGNASELRTQHKRKAKQKGKKAKHRKRHGKRANGRHRASSRNG